MPDNDKPYVNPLLEEAFSKPKRIKLPQGSHASINETKRAPLQKSGKPQKPDRSNVIKTAVIGTIVGLVLIAISPIPNFVSVQVSEANATPAIKDIGEHSGFNLKGKLLFFRANPELVNADVLDSNCPNDSETSIEFGCYLPAQNKIYILEVPDAKYKQVEYTTAAHETLHAAWHKLTDTERGEVAAQLKTLYDDKTNPTSAKLTDELKSYGSDEAVIYSELHSFLGSEYDVSQVNQQLSTYYSKYFDNQTVPATANDQFNSAIDTEIANLDAQYNQLDSINSNADTYKAQHLDNIQAAMRRADYYGDTYSYNQNVDAYNHNLVYYNSLVDQFNSQRNTYNTEVDSFNAVLKVFYPTRTQVKLFPQ